MPNFTRTFLEKNTWKNYLNDKTGRKTTCLILDTFVHFCLVKFQKKIMTLFIQKTTSLNKVNCNFYYVSHDISQTTCTCQNKGCHHYNNLAIKKEKRRKILFSTRGRSACALRKEKNCRGQKNNYENNFVWFFAAVKLY